MLLLHSQKLIYSNKIFLSDLRKLMFAKSKFLEFLKNNEHKNVSN